MKNTSQFLHANSRFIAADAPQSRAQSLAQPVNPPAAPSDLVNAFHAAFGDHHARAVHSKGIILGGSFIPDEQAAALTLASHLQEEPSRVVVRFSDFTGLPDIPDNISAASPRGLAIKFILPGGANTDVVCHSFNGFPVATSDEFRLFLLSIGASGPNATKPTALDHFLDTHPFTKTFLTTQNLPASWATAAYFGVNSFKFTNWQGAPHYIRYQFIPTAGEHYLTPEELAKKDSQFLTDEIKARAAAGSFGFSFYAQLADQSDDIENPAIAWPDIRRRVLLGTVTINKLSTNTPEEDKATQFNPGNLPAGIEMADDMVKLRAAAYPISVKERQ
jgi:catalase